MANYVYNGTGRIWLVCSWEKGPICYGLTLDIIGSIALISFFVLVVGTVFFGWLGIFPKAIRRKLHD
ncbi:CRE-SPE-29 protein [Caenorhabditis remanei]|uniref:CRE-SPE-29 protein n=2 Tax=Caenorhabditis remanei TaxID=31234 RepID=E3NP09_CAERE|nr:CRE-SPE-29 protein [Caenorhabditis remanei]